MPEQLSGIVTDALHRVRRSSGVPLAFAGVVNGPTNLRLQHFAGTTVGALSGVSVDVGHGLGGKVVSLSRPMVVDDYLRTPRITHRYNTIIEREGLRAMMAAPVIVDRTPVAVIYGALHTPDPIGGRMLDILAMEARAVEQEIVAGRARLEHAAQDEAEIRDRMTAAYARLRSLADTVDDACLADEIAAITEVLVAGSSARVPAVELTGREQDVLSLAALGYPNARIAETLGVTVYTVKGYMKDAMRKLGASSRLEAVVTARRAGLLP
ncbi:GAF domain-containing protein [Gordonia sp. zg691]|uniref:GAF domain-containing protein n=1 Tax=Gordonia jinghuaiqii TaxID=2758710 RepID=A0A7D7R2N1_9ACTN|nr:LuxR C-terminal-related transcriptional regulator [Gordonia jinghuaiqii]MBD0862940.1 GAF domain-containing protein [Gordonia jinghuaiqii]MCR5978935.1 GAF domain-containing protein [Gordonia jinghuaiqii]QMT01727.1 GAF domain-containing protein [Gordonia jinghuaiqii]